MENNIVVEIKNNHGEMIGEAKTFEEFKGAGVFADLLLTVVERLYDHRPGDLGKNQPDDQERIS